MEPHHRRPAFTRRSAAISLVAAAAVALALAACGGSGKPAYCSAVDNLKSSITALPSTNIVQNGLSSLETAVNKVKANAKTVVSDAKSDFPSQTSALKSSIDALTATAKQAKSSPSPATLVQLPGQVSAVVSAANDFKSAVSSKCG